MEALALLKLAFLFFCSYFLFNLIFLINNLCENLIGHKRWGEFKGFLSYYAYKCLKDMNMIG